MESVSTELLITTSTVFEGAGVAVVRASRAGRETGGHITLRRCAALQNNKRIYLSIGAKKLGNSSSQVQGMQKFGAPCSPYASLEGRRTPHLPSFMSCRPSASNPDYALRGKLRCRRLTELSNTVPSVSLLVRHGRVSRWQVFAITLLYATAYQTSLRQNWRRRVEEVEASLEASLKKAALYFAVSVVAVAFHGADHLSMACRSLFGMVFVAAVRGKLRIWPFGGSRYDDIFFI